MYIFLILAFYFLVERINNYYFPQSHVILMWPWSWITPPWSSVHLMAEICQFNQEPAQEGILNNELFYSLIYLEKWYFEVAAQRRHVNYIQSAR